MVRPRLSWRVWFGPEPPRPATSSTLGPPPPTAASPPLDSVAAGGDQSVAKSLTGLQPWTTYHYRLRIDNVNGSWIGEDRAFTTASPPAPPGSAGPPLPAISGEPSIGGKAKLGRNVSWVPGNWSGWPTFSYAWLRNGDPIAGQTAVRHEISKKGVGKALQCEVTAPNAAGSAVADSKPRVLARRKRTKH